MFKEIEKSVKTGTRQVNPIAHYTIFPHKILFEGNLQMTVNNSGSLIYSILKSHYSYSKLIGILVLYR